MLASAPRVLAETIDGQGFTEVRFRRPRRWVRLIGLAALTVFWLFGLFFAALLLAARTDEGPAMLVTWLVLWTVLGLVWFVILLWGALGVESLIARVDSLTLLRRLGFIRRPLVMPAAEISSLAWLADDPTHRVVHNGRRIPQSALGIVWQGRTVRCARGIDEAEAQRAIGSIRQRLGTPRRPR